MAKFLLVALIALVASATAIEKVRLRDLVRPMQEINPTPEIPLPAQITLNTVTQRVDNFDTQNTTTYQQRYYENSEFYQPGGPLYIYLGGEWTISPGQVTSSLMVEMAEENNGYAFYLEHRFYGESFPTEDVSDENLRFLTPDQALADIAHFIDFLQDTIPGADASHVVVIGAHYSGTLAIWFRQKYPHLALAAWASSAPMIGVFNHDAFKETAAATFRSIGGDECYDAIEAGFDDMEQMVVDGQFAELTALFNLCSPLDNTPNDISLFFALLAEFYSVIPTTATIASVNGVCQLVRAPAARRAAAIASIIPIMVGNVCLIVDYDDIIEADREFELDAPSVTSGFRQGSYQLCTQIGWHHTSDSDEQPFGERFPLDFFIESCEDVFTDIFSNATANMNVDRLNTIHGGLNPEVRNAIFTHGELDPWRTIGVLEDLNDDAPAFVIAGGRQAADIPATAGNDSPALREVKLAVKSLLRSWMDRADGLVIEPL